MQKGYRSTHLNQVFMDEEGAILPIEADMVGAKQIKPLNPYARVGAETIAWCAGVNVRPFQPDGGGQDGPLMVLADIHHGDWTAVSGVDFGAGASAFAASVSCMNDGGVIELRLDSPEGPRIGTLQVPSTADSGAR